MGIAKKNNAQVYEHNGFTPNDMSIYIMQCTVEKKG